MWKALGRWPLVLVAAVCIIAGVRLVADIGPQGNLGAATVLLTLGALLLGCFLVLYIQEKLHDLNHPPPPKEDDDDAG